MNKCNINNLSKSIMSQLTEYSDDIAEFNKKCVDKVAKEVNEEIKAHITFEEHTGDYVRSFAIKTVYENKYNKRKKWHVKDPHYRLTHLLEKGHAKVNGDERTREFPHIIYGEILAQQNLPKYIKEGIKNGIK